ncbi:M24 family metallopeptidase [Chloroflexota bacterium]
MAYGYRYGQDYGMDITDTRQKIDFDQMRKYKLDRARAQIQKDGLGAVLLYEPCNIRYTSSFSVPAYARGMLSKFYVLLPKNGEPYFFASKPIDEIHREQMPWLNVKPSGADTDWRIRQGAKFFAGEYEKEIADILYEHGVNNEPLGLDSLAAGSVFALIEAFKRVDLKLVDARGTMLEARKIKSLDEIECMRMSHAIAEAAQAEARDIIRPGITEKEVAGAMMNKLLSMGAEWVDGFVVVSGPNSSPCRKTFTDRIIRAGDMVMVDVVGSQFLGYRTCVYRCFTCGRATQEQKELWNETRDLVRAAMSKCKAGNTSADVVSVWPGPEYWGYALEDVHILWQTCVVHGLGLSQYDLPRFGIITGKEEPILIEENMVMAVEVNSFKKGGRQGCQMEEVIAVKKDGYDQLSTFPSDELIECWI